MFLVMTAQGIPFLHGGQDFLRSKKNDPNSYRSSDDVNSLKWYMLDKNGLESDYCRGLISFRKKHPGLRMRTESEVSSAYEVLASPDGTVELRLNTPTECLLILVNPVPRAKMMTLPDGEWYLHVSDIAASESPMATYCEGIIVPPISGMVLIRKENQV